MDHTGRLKQLHECKEKVAFYKNQMLEFLQELGWTEEKLLELTKSKKVKEEIVESGYDVAGSSSSKQSQQVNIKQENSTDDLKAIVDLCSTIDEKRSASNSFVDLNKLKRDLKRRRVKYRTTKNAPLTYTEEMRELINLQMDIIKENRQK